MALNFDVLEGWIWYDGELVPWGDAQLHVLSHGLHFSSSVFEGMRVYSGRIFKLRQHIERLHRSAELCGYQLPYAIEELESACFEAVKAQDITDGYIRPIAWRGAQSMAPVAHDCIVHVAVAAWKWPVYYSKESKMQGISLGISEWRRPPPDTAPTASKASGLYQICTLAKHAADNAGYDDALMYCYRGLIAETTSSNIFFVMDNELHTPIADCFLDGITRQTVIEISKRIDLKCVERFIKPEEMENASEAFITGTAAEVTPVRSIGDYSFTPGQVTRTIMDAYDDETKKPS